MAAAALPRRTQEESVSVALGKVALLCFLRKQSLLVQEKSAARCYQRELMRQSFDATQEPSGDITSGRFTALTSSHDRRDERACWRRVGARDVAIGRQAGGQQGA